MQNEIIDAVQEPENTATNATRKHIRGSSLLLVGRLVMLGLNFGVQVLTVRYLTKSDFGAFSFAMSFVAVSAVVALFGLDKAVSRFVSIYHEQKDYARMFGTILMTFATILFIGTVLVFVGLGIRNQIGSIFQTDALTVSLVMIVMVMGPISALESYFQDMLAVFASVRSIFLRRFLLGPAFKLAAVVAVVLLKGDVHMLAFGYLVGSLFGIVVYAYIMVKVWHKQGLLRHFNPKNLIFPVREVYGFSVPLLTTDFLQVVKGSAVIMILEYFRTSTEVAEYRAIVPVAGMNLVVMQSFRLLYTPMAARLYANKDTESINALYWKTATWIALISFPVFVVTFSLSEPLVLLLFGDRYALSGPLLALLSFGNYFNAALGFNAFTLRVYGKVKYIVLIDVLSSILNLGLNFLLIPRYGAMGAAVGTCITLVAYNIFNHAGLLLGTGINLFERRYMLMYASILLASIGLIAFESIFRANIVISLLLAGVVSLALLRINRETLDVKNTFPELLRLPLLRPLLGF